MVRGRRNWSRVRPTSLRHALELCKEHAQEKRNLSVERIAERMGLESHWIIYKWIEGGNIPLVKVPAFEHVCGIDFATRWMASSADKLLIDIPTGKAAKPEDVAALQEVLSTAANELIKFYNGNGDAAATLTAIQKGMEQLAFHRKNVSKSAQPELNLEA